MYSRENSGNKSRKNKIMISITFIAIIITLITIRIRVIKLIITKGIIVIVERNG